MSKHECVVTDSKRGIDTSQASQLDQAGLLSSWVNQTPAGASREHRGLHSTWSWLLTFTLRRGRSWSKGFVWFQDPEPLQKSVHCNQNATYCNLCFSESGEGVTFSWDQEGVLLIHVCVKQQHNFEPPLLSHQFKSWRVAKMAILCRMRSLGTNWCKEGCTLSGKSLLISYRLDTYSQKSLKCWGLNQFGCIYP